VIIGGVYEKEDDSLKISINKPSGFKNVITFGDFNIDFPHKDRISNIEIQVAAGDALRLFVSYYDDVTDAPNVKTWTEEYTVGEFSMSLRSKSRVAAHEIVSPGYEEKRNKLLGIEKDAVSYKDSIKVIKN